MKFDLGLDRLSFAYKLAYALLIIGVISNLFQILFSNTLIYIAILIISALYLKDEIRNIRSVKGFYRFALLIIPILSAALCIQSFIIGTGNCLPIMLLFFMYTTLKGKVTR